MKKTQELISLFVPLALLFGIGYAFPVSFSFPIESLIVYAVCLLACPLWGLCRFSALARGILFGVSAFLYAAGIPAAILFGGPVLAEVLLGIGTLFLGTLLVFYALPDQTEEELHLLRRGLRASHARRTLLKGESYAFFFQKSGLLFGITTIYSLFIKDTLTLSSLYSGAFSSVLFGVLGILLYCFLGAPRAAKRKPSEKKSVYIFASLLAFLLILILVYVYVGSLYTSPDPALSAALTAVQKLLTPALLGTALGFILGILLGWLLSLSGVRLFVTVLGGMALIPFALWTVLVYTMFGDMPHAAFGAICIVQTLCTALCTLRARQSLLPFRGFPIKERRRALMVPLFHLPTLSLLPALLLSALTAVLCMERATLAALGELALAFAAAILAVFFGISLILTYLTKEVRPNA